jgi:hypothetical protein
MNQVKLKPPTKAFEQYLGNIRAEEDNIVSSRN